MSALVRFCGATYELTLAPSFRIGDYPTFSAAFLDITLSAAAILVTPGSALATLCRRVIQIGSLNESHVLTAASYQTSAFDGRSIRPVCDAWSMAFRPARGCRRRANAKPGACIVRCIACPQTGGLQLYRWQERQRDQRSACRRDY